MFCDIAWYLIYLNAWTKLQVKHPEEMTSYNWFLTMVQHHTYRLTSDVHGLTRYTKLTPGTQQTTRFTPNLRSDVHHTYTDSHETYTITLDIYTYTRYISHLLHIYTQTYPTHTTRIHTRRTPNVHQTHTRLTPNLHHTRHTYAKLTTNPRQIHTRHNQFFDLKWFYFFLDPPKAKLLFACSAILPRVLPTLFEFLICGVRIIRSKNLQQIRMLWPCLASPTLPNPNSLDTQIYNSIYGFVLDPQIIRNYGKELFSSSN